MKRGDIQAWKRIGVTADTIKTHRESLPGELQASIVRWFVEPPIQSFVNLSLSMMYSTI